MGGDLFYAATMTGKGGTASPLLRLAIVSAKNGQGKTFRLRHVSITLASKATTRLPGMAPHNHLWGDNPKVDDLERWPWRGPDYHSPMECHRTAESREKCLYPTFRIPFAQTRNLQ